MRSAEGQELEDTQGTASRHGHWLARNTIYLHVLSISPAKVLPGEMMEWLLPIPYPSLQKVLQKDRYAFTLAP